MSESQAGLPAATSPYPPGWTAPDDPAGDRSGSRRPGTVLAAVTVTWVASSIVLLATVSLVVFALWLGGPLLDSFEGSRRLVLLMAAGTAAWSVGAGWLGWCALTGRNWARWALTASAVGTVLVSVPGIFLVVPVVPLVAAPIAVALLFTGGANEWYRQQA